MKRITPFLGVALALALASYSTQTHAAPAKEAQPKQEASMKIHLKMGAEVLTATLLDTETSRDFLSLLPLKLRLTDYAGAEKTSDLPRKLSTKQAPAGYAPSVGDLALYAPWGNLAAFYKDAGYAQGLIKLGRLDGGIEKLAGRKGDFAVELMRADSNKPNK